MNNTVAIIACLKCEELYIKEWLDWHISCGIDHFYLCDNNDSTYTPRLKDVIKEYIDNKIVDVFDYHDVHPIQPICYDDIYQKYGDIYDWYLIIDIDEFICLPKFNNDLKSYINTIPNNIINIGINWMYYGDNDLITYDSRPVQERFTKPITHYNNGNVYIYKGYSRITKTLFAKRSKFNDQLTITSQHYIDKFLKRYDVIFNNIRGTTANNLIEDKLLSDSSYTNDIYSTFYIKHFVTKTAEEYCWKILRGDTLKNKTDEKYPYKKSAFYGFNMKTEEKQKIFEKYLSKETI